MGLFYLSYWIEYVFKEMFEHAKKRLYVIRQGNQFRFIAHIVMYGMENIQYFIKKSKRPPINKKNYTTKKPAASASSNMLASHEWARMLDRGKSAGDRSEGPPKTKQ